MGLKEVAKDLFCTWDGLYRLKKWLCLLVGFMVILSSVFSLINILKTVTDFLGTVRTFWNILFGTLMILHEFKFTTWISLRFGFLTGWFGRGMFYLFVGTNIMGTGEAGFWRGFSYFAGGCCLFAGAIEIIFGFKCAESETAKKDAEYEEEQRQKRADAAAGVGSGPPPPADPAGKRGWFGGGGQKPAQTEPTITVNCGGAQANLTTAQAAQGAQWAANNAGTVAAVANAASSNPNAGAASSNPFFGNAHLQNRN